MAEQKKMTANEFVNVRDITHGLIETKDGYLIGLLRSILITWIWCQTPNGRQKPIRWQRLFKTKNMILPTCPIPEKLTWIDIIIC